MADIFHNFPINAPSAEVFLAISSPAGLNNWWTDTCQAVPGAGAEYEMGFGPGYDWTAVASKFVPDSEFQFTFTKADKDWQQTVIDFQLVEKSGVTEVTFGHLGWPELNEHYRISCFCWAMYLRLLKRFVEFGEVVPYAQRLDV